MNTEAKVLLVIQTRVRPDKNSEFEQWQARVATTIKSFPGFVAQEIHRPNPPAHIDWVIIYSFTTEDAAKAWLQSPARSTLLAQVLPVLMGVDTVYLMHKDVHDRSTVTATISAVVDPHNEAQFLDWQARVAPMQSEFPGFVGYALKKPQPGVTDAWVATVTFDTDQHLDAWLKSPQREVMLKELGALSREQRIEKLYAGFDFWFNQTGAKRSVWKENMLVLLTLYPVVFLLSYVQNPLINWGVPFWLALFFGNAASTVILGNVTTPWLMQRFTWWLKPKTPDTTTTIFGATIVMLLYGISLGICWFLSSLK